MIDRLSPTDHEAIILVELEGLIYQEAATKLGLSVPGMTFRVQRPDSSCAICLMNANY